MRPCPYQLIREQKDPWWIWPGMMCSIALLCLLLTIVGCVEGPAGPGTEPLPAGGELESLSFEGETAVLLQSAQSYEALAEKLLNSEITTADQLLKAIGEVDRAARNDGYLLRDTSFGNCQYVETTDPVIGAQVRWSPAIAAQGLKELARGKRRRAGQ